MTGHQFANLRRHLGLSLADFGRALGYQGAARNVRRQIRRYEDMDEVPPGAAMRASTLDDRPRRQ